MREVVTMDKENNEIPLFNIKKTFSCFENIYLFLIFESLTMNFNNTLKDCENFIKGFWMV